MSRPSFNHFGIVGAGAWGTALAVTLLRGGHDVTLWAHEPETAEAINDYHENKIFLPGIALDPHLHAVTSLSKLVSCDAWILATPAQHIRRTCQELAPFIRNIPAPIIIAAKGLEESTSAFLSTVVAHELFKHSAAVLSGPSFAVEVARGQPAALTLATKEEALGESLANAMATPAFRLYRTNDVIGAQIGGAVKNVLAVACGIVAGRGMGENARAALITRGLAEVVRLGLAMSARMETMMGLSGVGDLVLTCSSTQSRNMSLGFALGQGKTLADILASRTSVTEGVTTAAAAHELAKKRGVDMPIVAAVNAVLNHKADIDQTIGALLARPLKNEIH
jgi:glycerol-3-phosphate dehydrogenase (NAD(P)+)